MTMRGALGLELPLDRIPGDEPGLVLSDQFPGAEMAAGTTAWLHKRSDGSDAMSVRYEDNEIVSVDDISLTATERGALADAVTRAASADGAILMRQTCIPL